MIEEILKTNLINECSCSIDKCDILDFMAKYVGVNVLHPGGLRSTYELLTKLNIKEQSSILDVACGKGTSSYYFVKNYNCNVTGIDIDENFINYAKKLSIKKKKQDKMKFQFGNAENLPFTNDTFDIVIFQAALVLIENMEKSISEAARVIKKGGKIGILELTWLKDPTEKIIESAKKDICSYCIPRAKTIDGWKNLLTNAGMKIEEAHIFPLLSSSRNSNEGIGTMIKVMFKMVTNTIIRKRLSKMNQFFKDSKGYLGYSIIVGKK